MLVHSYSRFSDTSQAKGDSLRRQQQQAAEFCLRRGWKLSELKFNDLGRSAFKANKQRALDAFLKAIDDGRVKRGECLLVEAVDRLSRKGIRQTQNLVNRILDAGVSIAILTPFEKVYHPGTTDNDIGFAVELAAFAFQAAAYSENLSYRLKQQGAKQRAAFAKGEVKRVSGNMPGWLEWTGSQYRAIPEKVKAVRYLFRRTVEGIGRKQLVREMNEKFPPLYSWKTTNGWNDILISQILQSRRVLGDTVSTVSGETYSGIYPQIIDEQTWKLAQASIANRRRVRGRQSQKVNILSGVLRNAADGASCSVYASFKKLSDGSRRIDRRYQSYDASRGVSGACRVTYKVEQLEVMLFEFLPQLDLSKGVDAGRLDLETERQSIADDITELKSQISSRAAAAAVLAGPLVDLQERLEQVDRQLSELPSEQAPPTRKYREQLAALRRGTNEERLLVKERLGRIIKAVWMLPIKTGPARNAAVRMVLEIHFQNGQIRRGVEIDGQLIQAAATKPIRDQVLAGTVFDAEWYTSAAKSLNRKKK